MPIETMHSNTNGRSLDLVQPPTDAGAILEGRPQLGQLITDVQNLVTLATSLAAEKATQLASDAGARLQAARISVTRISDSAVKQTLKTARATDGLVRARPWQSIGIAAAAGLLAGFVISRRR